MNERIKELAEQATTEDFDGFMFFDKQKFAELIIKECASYMKQSNAFTHLNQADDCARMMLKHFGVEE